MTILPGRATRAGRALVAVSDLDREPTAQELAELDAEVPLLLAEAEAILLAACAPAERADELTARRHDRVRRWASRPVGPGGDTTPREAA